MRCVLKHMGLAVGVFLFVLACVLAPSFGGFVALSAPATEKGEVVGKWKHWRDFIRAHFRPSLPPMGEAPASYKGMERSLLPESCGSCHPAQYAQWKTSLHAKAMGPGVYGQLVEMWKTNPEGARGCNECHAPLAEQQKRAQRGVGPLARWEKNPVHDPRLEMHGLTCASCHVRNWRVYGPQKAQTPAGVNDTTSSGAHAGVERTPFFSRAEFCMTCHQHEFPGPNGKAIQNTYNEWKDSLWGREGVACQSCHMPGRAHLWRGIHDRDMTQGALYVEVMLAEKVPRDVVAARITLTNTGAGHYFPTYITPSVDVVSELEDEQGRRIPGSRQVDVIERRLSPDFSREIRDTRIPPQKSITFPYRKNRLRGAVRLRVRVHVRPDAFYYDFYTRFLEGGSISESARRLITQAREVAGSSSFDIYDETFELKN